jgi:myo-inositol-1(or 4)-monophosphatase
MYPYFFEKVIDMDKENILKVAQEAALLAGNYLKKNYGKIKRPEVEFKGEIDLVTKCDKESQEIICSILEKKFPNHSILAEEDLSIEKEKELLWLIDPLDGTTNFAHSLPVFSVSIAFFQEGKPVVGIVYAPILEEMFHAVTNGGAFLNREIITVSREKDLGNSVLATGFPYDCRESKQNNLENFSRFLVKARAIRRWGVASIDLAYIAAGRFEAFWEPKLKPWDTAAGMLLVQEAGGKVTDYSENPYNPFMQEILATNSYIHEQMLKVIQPHGMRDL